MSEGMEELARRLVAGRKRDGRAVYDEQAKAELVAMCAAPGASVSRLARECGVNANQLSRWIRESAERQQRTLVVATEPPAAAFLPITMEVQPSIAAEPTCAFRRACPTAWSSICAAAPSGKLASSSTPSGGCGVPPRRKAEGLPAP